MSKDYFSEVISDFYQYLSGVDGVSVRSRTNYLSWLKFLSKRYALCASMSNADIEDILSAEEIARTSRSIYTKKADIANFRSALRKYKSFLVSDYRRLQEETILAEERKVKKCFAIPNTEKTAIIRARVGQGLFRERLISYWRGCSISNFKYYDLLVASHIKPWKVSDNNQRIDVFNGLLLLPNYDKLFDRGYISFDANGRIVFSSYFPRSDRAFLGMTDAIHLLKISDSHQAYLKYHRDNCLLH